MIRSGDHVMVDAVIRSLPARRRRDDEIAYFGRALTERAKGQPYSRGYDVMERERPAGSFWSPSDSRSMVTAESMVWATLWFWWPLSRLLLRAWPAFAFWVTRPTAVERQGRELAECKKRRAALQADIARRERELGIKDDVLDGAFR